MNKPWTRAGMTVVTVGVIGFASTIPAQAEEPEYNYGGLFGADSGYVLNTAAGELPAEPTGIYPEEDEAGEARAYRLDTVAVPGDIENVYEKYDWSKTSIDGLAKANWIIRNAFPTVDAATLADKAEADLSGVDDPGLVAYTATQAAIWSHTADVELSSPDATDQDDAVDAAVLAIAEYLSAPGDEAAEPSDEFSIDTSKSKDGKRIGPFTVEGVDDEGWVMAQGEDGREGGKVVDANGDKLSDVESGGEFYIEPNNGVKKLTITVTAKDAPEAGTLMLARDVEDQPSLMLAEDAGYGVLASVDITTGSGGGGRLPVTGTSLTGVMGIGALLLLGGAVLLFVMRRKPAAAPAA